MWTGGCADHSLARQEQVLWLCLDLKLNVKTVLRIGGRGGGVNSAIQIKLFSSADPDLYLLGGRGGGCGLPDPEIWGGGARLQEGPLPWIRHCWVKYQFYKRWTMTQGFFFLKKAINVFITNNTKGSSNVYITKIKAREKAKKQIPIGFPLC